VSSLHKAVNWQQTGRDSNPRPFAGREQMMYQYATDQSKISRNYTVSQKNDNDVPCYNFNAHQPILIIFGRDIAE